MTTFQRARRLDLIHYKRVAVVEKVRRKMRQRRGSRRGDLQRETKMQFASGDRTR
jgi:hypothetical protein